MIEFYESLSIFLFVDTVSLSFQEPKDQHLYLFIKTVVNGTIFSSREVALWIIQHFSQGVGRVGGLFIWWRINIINKYK
jgi:hypothetical protein